MSTDASHFRRQRSVQTGCKRGEGRATLRAISQAVSKPVGHVDVLGHLCPQQGSLSGRPNFASLASNCDELQHTRGACFGKLSWPTCESKLRSGIPRCIRSRTHMPTLSVQCTTLYNYILQLRQFGHCFFQKQTNMHGHVDSALG